MLSKKPTPKSVLGMDVGRRRIGLAGCDPLGITITPLPAIQRKTFEHDIKLLKRQCLLRSVEGLIAGIPLDSRGLPTKQSKFCRHYAQKVSIALEVPLALVNEHSSTWAASHRFSLQKDKSGELDSASAMVLVEQWLKEGPEVMPVKLTTFPNSELACDGES